VAHAAAETERWHAPGSRYGLTAPCDELPLPRVRAEATRLPGVRVLTDDTLDRPQGGAELATRCAWLARGGANIASVTVLPGGAWAWDEFRTLPGVGATPVALTGLRAADHAYRGTAPTGDATLDLLLWGTWVHVSLVDDGTVHDVDAALRIIGDDFVTRANAD
jgi:hypothetical protein